MSNLIKTQQVAKQQKEERPRRGVVLALDQHFQKYNPNILEDLDHSLLFADNESLFDDGPEAA